MPLEQFQCSDFRCFASAELEIDRRYSLVYGPNASGKTSLLEAIAYLGRGRSFRGANTRQLVRHGASEFVLLGKVARQERLATVGVSNGPNGLEIRIDGDRAAGAADLATMLPLQTVDPEVHQLVAGGPEQRRRYLDWIAFHVEHGYLERWRRFRRALKQRNSALREGAGDRELDGWDRQLAETGLEVDAARRRILEITLPALLETGETLLGSAVSFEYVQGWSAEQKLDEAIRAGRERDRQQANSRAGPHRADLKLRYDERQARKLVSRGQQKLLASTLILAAAEMVQLETEQPLLLLLDDLWAELDVDSLARLIASIDRLGCQVIASSLVPEVGLFPEPPGLFHVEQGRVKKQQ